MLRYLAVLMLAVAVVYGTSSTPASSTTPQATTTPAPTNNNTGTTMAPTESTTSGSAELLMSLPLCLLTFFMMLANLGA